MYTEEVVSISKADDGGYIIHVKVKKKKQKDSKGEICYPRHEDKTLLEKDVEGVKETLAKILPDIKAGGMEEDDFADAFKEAAKEEA